MDRSTTMLKDVSPRTHNASVRVRVLNFWWQAASGKDLMLELMVGDEQVIASENQAVWWTTPLGLPVIQPYFKNKNLSSGLGFATGRDAGMCFAGVHDSFWTHACDADNMNIILPEEFVELYSTPMLENLLESFETTYPGLEFPPLLQRGGFDSIEVQKSP